MCWHGQWASTEACDIRLLRFQWVARAQATRGMPPSTHLPYFRQHRIAFADNMHLSSVWYLLSRSGKEGVKVQNKCMDFRGPLSCGDQLEWC